MISSSEVGGCCRVQVAWLYPSLALSASSSSSFSFSSSSFSSCFLPPFLSRFSSRASVFSYSLVSPLDPFIVLFNPLRALGHSTKNSDPTVEATHARRGLRACKVAFPSIRELLPGTCRLFMAPSWQPSNVHAFLRSFYFVTAGILSAIEIFSRKRPGYQLRHRAAVRSITARFFGRHQMQVLRVSLSFPSFACTRCIFPKMRFFPFYRWQMQFSTR